MGGPRGICIDPRVEALGAAARRARRRRGPVIVAASTIGTWYWCPRKAWLDDTLFNAGWLSEREVEALRDPLASLWRVQLLRSRRPSVRRGRRIHGEYVGVELEDFDECLLVDMGARGLIDPARYEEQVERLERATDPVEYFRREEWPLFRYAADGYEILGVPDDVRRGSEGVIVEELKTTSNPKRFAEGPGLQAALHQLAAYYLALSQRWRVEELVLRVVDQRTRATVYLRRLKPRDIEPYAEEALEAARRIASTTPPRAPSDTSRCNTCEYTASPARCTPLY